MGIYSRDYIRDKPDPPSFGGGTPGSVCKTLIIANVAVFLLQIFTPITVWLQLAPGDIVPGLQVWRLLTYAFCHSQGSLFHLLFNMLFLWWFGKTLEMMFGAREFLFFYLTAAFVAGLCYVGLGLFLGNMAPAIGASGAVMAIMMVYALYYPRQQILLMAIIPLEIRWLVLGYVIFDSWPILQALSGVPGAGDGIAHSAHLGGLAFGYLYKANGIKLERFFGGVGRPRFDRWFGSRRGIRVYRPSSEPDRLDEQVDAILEKIHQQGEASLTDRERDVLKRASKRASQKYNKG